jgi:hypothetical protein
VRSQITRQLATVVPRTDARIVEEQKPSGVRKIVRDIAQPVRFLEVDLREELERHGLGQMLADMVAVAAASARRDGRRLRRRRAQRPGHRSGQVRHATEPRRAEHGFACGVGRLERNGRPQPVEKHLDRFLVEEFGQRVARSCDIGKHFVARPDNHMRPFVVARRLKVHAVRG